MTVWIYVDSSKDLGDKDHLTVFATIEAAEAWFEENDPEGVAFEYDVIASESARSLSTSKENSTRAAELADKVIDDELPADADPQEKAARKRELMQGPSMVRESRKDRPQ
jgi:hypothetical protein